MVKIFKKEISGFNKLFMLIILVLLFKTQSYAYSADTNKTITLSSRTLTLREIFSQVEKQTGLITVFSNNELDMTDTIKLESIHYKLKDLYTYILKNTNLEFDISEKYIVIKPRPRHPEKDGNQKRKITGRVMDEKGEPLPGANIIIKGTTTGAVANPEGYFELYIPVKDALVIEASFVGMEPTPVNITPEQNSIVFHLSLKERNIQEVIIVGAYGTSQKRSDLVSSVFQVNEKQLEMLPASRIDKILDGLIPGMQITYNSDDASNTKTRYNIRVRGEGSMSASNEPIWVIDGIPYYTGERTNLITGINTSVSPLSYINPADIESMTLLKDASATAIYGANGANGVILVTTKRGKNSEMQVSVSQRNGISKINESTRFKVLNAEQYLTLAREAYVNAGKDLNVFPFQDNALNSYSTTNTDWSKVFYGTGSTNQTNLSVSGGSDRISYYVSGSYFKEKSTIIGNTQERYSTHGYIDMKMNKWLRFIINTSASYNVNNNFNPGMDYFELLPIYSPYNADGTFRLYNREVSGINSTTGELTWSTSKFLNSVAEREENDDYQHAVALMNNASAEIRIIEGLNYTLQLGTDYQSINEYVYQARSNWSGVNLAGKKIGYATKNSASFLNFTAIQRINFNRQFGKHMINAVLGMESSSKNTNTISATGSGFVNDKVKEVSYAVDKTGSGSRSTDKTLSYLFQGNYGFDNRYYLSISARRDGSSGFGPDAKWENYSSAGVSWNFHNEKFYPFKFIHVFKLKATYGTNGNSRIGTQEALGLYSYSESDNYMGNPGASLSGSPNPTLSWEIAHTTNLGIRLKFWDRIDLEIDAYWKRTKKLISKLDVSRTTGDTRVYRNSGEVMNKGIEMNIEALVVQNKNIDWMITVNASHNNNKLINLYNGIEKVMGNYIWREGYDMNTFYLIRWAGVDPRDGMPLWYDDKGNVTRTYSADNRVAWKSSSPILTGGLTNSFKYKNLTLSAQFSYVLGGYAFSTFGRNVSSDGYEIMDYNQSINQLDRWQKPGDITNTPKLLWGTSTKSVMNSTRYVYKTTYLNLKNIALSYMLPARFYKKLGITSCQISLIGDNLGLWTPYDKKNRNSYKQSISGYPMETTYTVGIDMSF
jgi:TonB-linked SusC/RagA family outer membrane protein